MSAAQRNVQLCGLQKISKGVLEYLSPNQLTKYSLEHADKPLNAALLNAILVGSGGFFGALFRYGLGGLVHRLVPLTTFPYGTMSVNLIGCLLIGLFAGMADSRQLFSPEVRTFAMVGVLGGFTTFSTLSYESFAMIRDQEYLRAAANVGLHVVLGIALVWVGYSLITSR